MKNVGTVARIHSELSAAGADGLTAAEAERITGLGHGSVSGALSRLHQTGFAARLTEKREGRHRVYVSSPYVQGRPTQPYGRAKAAFRVATIQTPPKPDAAADVVRAERERDEVMAERDEMAHRLSEANQRARGYEARCAETERTLEATVDERDHLRDEVKGLRIQLLGEQVSEPGALVEARARLKAVDDFLFTLDKMDDGAKIVFQSNLETPLYALREGLRHVLSGEHAGEAQAAVPVPERTQPSEPEKPDHEPFVEGVGPYNAACICGWKDTEWHDARFGAIRAGGQHLKDKRGDAA